MWYEAVETLLFEMDRNGVERAVLIQILGQSDNAPEQLRELADTSASGVGLP